MVKNNYIRKNKREENDAIHEWKEKSPVSFPNVV